MSRKVDINEILNGKGLAPEISNYDESEDEDELTPEEFAEILDGALEYPELFETVMSIGSMMAEVESLNNRIDFQISVLAKRLELLKNNK